MDPNRFDAITTSLGTARSRRGVLTALGGALVGALALRRAARAAPPEACRQTWGACRDQASAAMNAGVRACLAGPTATRDDCLFRVRDAAAQAQQQCDGAYAQCIERLAVRPGARPAGPATG